MPRVIGIDHLVLSVGDVARSRDFYDNLLSYLGFNRKYDYPDMTGWITVRRCSGSLPPTRRAAGENTAKAISGFTIMRLNSPAATMSMRLAPFCKRTV